jgi:hypothetical protein
MLYTTISPKTMVTYSKNRYNLPCTHCFTRSWQIINYEMNLRNSHRGIINNGIILYDLFE